MRAYLYHRSYTMKSKAPRVLSATCYVSRFTKWFTEGGRRGKGILHREELATIAWRDLHRYFRDGDWEEIKTRRGLMPKWRNQLAWALVLCREDELGALIVRKGLYYYHLDMAQPDWESKVKKPRRPRRSPNVYKFLRDSDLKTPKRKKGGK
jgi:hypothetical protein